MTGSKYRVVFERDESRPDAEDGLRDLAERGHRGMLCRVVVERLAEQIAHEIERSGAS